MTPLRQVRSVAVPLAWPNIDTDQIVPARFLQKPRSVDFGAFLFSDVRKDRDGNLRSDFPLNDPAYVDARILVAGPNFGCGSSREHAVWALSDGGFRVVIAPSFGDIFYSNALKNGLLPIRLARNVVDALLGTLQRARAEVCVDLEAKTIETPDGTTIPFEIAAFARQCLLDGLDEIAYTLSQLARIEAFEARMRAEAHGSSSATGTH